MMTLYFVFISPSSTNLQQQQQHNKVIALVAFRIQLALLLG
jgi:hypothetical protein